MCGGSLTYTIPSRVTAILPISENCAATPIPSAYPFVLPARVLTVPSGRIFRILKLFLSTTYKFPALSIPISVGNENLAAAPTPSANPASLPARVVTVPSSSVPDFTIPDISIIPCGIFYRYSLLVLRRTISENRICQKE